MYGQRTTPDLTEVRSLQIDSRQKTAPRTRTMICASTSYFHASPSREAVVQGLPARRRTYPRKHVGDHAKYTTPHPTNMSKTPRTRTTSALKHLDPVNVEIDALSVRGGVYLNMCKKKNERKKRGANRKPATLCSHAKTSSHLELFGTPGMDTRTMDTVVFFVLDGLRSRWTASSTRTHNLGPPCTRAARPIFNQCNPGRKAETSLQHNAVGP